MIIRKHMPLILLSLSMISMIYILLWKSDNCINEQGNYISSSTPVEEFEMLDEKSEPIDGNNIFFLETSTSEVGNFNLSVSQACSIESAAKMNPGMRIYLLILSNATFSSATIENLNILSAYKNIATRRITLETYLKNTSIEEWWRTGIMKTSIYPTTHTSDILRLVTLWKFGGIYLDLDMIVKESLENMTNFAGSEDGSYVNNAALGFSATGVGRKFISAFLQDLKKNFNAKGWSDQGPLLITRVLKKLCRTWSVTDIISKKPCQGFTVYPTPSFYPIHWSNWESLYDEANYSSTMSKLDKSFTVHLWNACHGPRPFKFGSRTPYVTLMSEYCPKIYNSLDRLF